jgi:hypothetical protein
MKSTPQNMPESRLAIVPDLIKETAAQIIKIKY